MKITAKLIRETGFNFPRYSYLYELHRTLKDCACILDVGCGVTSPLRFLRGGIYKVAVDSFKPDLDKAKKFGVYNECKLIEALDIDKHFQHKSFDAVLLLDIIEHFEKEPGMELIKKAERIARKKVIVVTPNGFLPQPSINGNLQEHLSGWEGKEMEGIGYKITGLLGLKVLRQEYHNLKYRPKILWGIISELSHYLYTRNHPGKACSLFCVKNLC